MLTVIDFRTITMLFFNYSTKGTCVKSQRLQAVFEAAACELKFRVNTARVDKSTDGGATGRRFDVRDTPSFIL